MPKVKLPRKSTNIDMTAMCDVAFLLLSFFILTTKFKPSEALAVVTPNSVSSKAAPQKNVALVTIDKEGKVFFSWSEDAPGEDIIKALNDNRSLQLTPAEIQSLSKVQFIGVPINQLKSLATKNKDDWGKLQFPGIPVLDSTNNEMIDWARAAATAFLNKKMELLVKGDNNSKYPSFQAVLTAFKKNDLMKFQMVTNPVGVPEGSELYNKKMKEMASGKSSDKSDAAE